jgi:hypothetical protein
MSIGQFRKDQINILEDENCTIMAPRAQVAAVKEDPLLGAIEIIPVSHQSVQKNGATEMLIVMFG